jgi:nucleotide-binding universal stress UspA family protein
LYVVDDIAYLPSTEVMTPTLIISPEVINSYRNNIEELAIQLTLNAGIAVDGKIEQGNPADTICKVASVEKYDLIVMGTHGASGLREFFIGSNSFRVVKNATCPVLTVPGNWSKNTFKKVVFPIRLLPGAIDKYDYARPIIEKNISNLLIIGLADQNNPESFVELTKLVDLFRLQLSDDNVEFSSILYHSKNFPEKVLQGANEYEADLIVITANLDYDLKSFFIGPFAQQIVNHSKRPVLSIRAALLDEIFKTVNDGIKNMQNNYLNLDLA